MRTVHQPKRDWRAYAACANTDPDLFFPKPDEVWKVRQAKKICATCPVAAQCARFANSTAQQYGVWGGLTVNELRKIRTVKEAS